MEKSWKVFTSSKSIEIKKDERSGKYEAHDGGAHYIGNHPDDVFNSIQNTHSEAKAEWKDNNKLRDFMVMDMNGKVVGRIQAKNPNEAGYIAVQEFKEHGSSFFVTDRIYPKDYPSDSYEV